MEVALSTRCVLAISGSYLHLAALTPPLGETQDLSLGTVGFESYVPVIYLLIIRLS